MIPFRSLRGVPGGRPPGPAPRKPSPWVAVLTALAMVVAMTGPVAPASAAPAAGQRRPTPPPAAPRGPAVTGVVARKFHFVKPPIQADRRYVARRTEWPVASAGR